MLKLLVVPQNEKTEIGAKRDILSEIEIRKEKRGKPKPKWLINAVFRIV